MLLYLLVLASGLAGLGWEILWQHHASLALGVSAQGTALTLAGTMIGFAVGAALMGRVVLNAPPAHPARLYAMLEAAIGLAGLGLPLGFRWLEQADAAVFRAAPDWALAVHALGILLLIVVPALCMGATLPVYAVLCRRMGYRVSALYAVNLIGAAAGVLLTGFWFLPRFGVSTTLRGLVMLNLAVGAAALLLPLARRRTTGEKKDEGKASTPTMPLRPALRAVFLTGFLIFGLEVAWFRSLRATFQSNTDGFAVMLTAVLIALAAGSFLARRLPPVDPKQGGTFRPEGTPKPETSSHVPTRGLLPLLMFLGGTLVLLATPLLERLVLVRVPVTGFVHQTILRLVFSLAILGPPLAVLGAVLPWCLDQWRRPREVGWLAAINTLGATAGSLAAAWWLLPALGVSRTAWLLGGLALGYAALAQPPRGRVPVAAAALLLLLASWSLDAGVGRIRIQGGRFKAGYEVLFSRDGPESTVSVVENHQGIRDLVIDGFQTAGEGPAAHYMLWMGRLPMILHPEPRHALVICFGTGQTAHGVRDEGAQTVDIIDLNPTVYAVAPYFASNHKVLDDPRVQARVMDGRAWLRRTDGAYDVITLEPMAPYFAGMNALYSREFYHLARARMKPGGVIAQWLPFHLLSPGDAAGITRTFQETFASTWLWLDPIGQTGILLGCRDPSNGTGMVPPLPGLNRNTARDLTSVEIMDGFRLGPEGVRRYAGEEVPVTDDNQRLAYGWGRISAWQSHRDQRTRAESLERIREAKSTDHRF